MKTHRNSVISPAAVIATGLSVFLVSSAMAEHRTLKLSDAERVAILDEAATLTFKAPANVTGTAQILVVGGGGAGGGISGGGGGGGGLQNDGSAVGGAGGTGTVIIRYAVDRSQLAVDFAVDSQTGIPPFETVFTATVDQPTGSTATLTWDFGDGSSPLETDSLSVNHTYAVPGVFTVSLSVSAAGQTVKKTVANCVTVANRDIYVDAASENELSPYATPETAAKTVTDALAAVVTVGQRILVKPGTYPTERPIRISADVEVLGLGATPGEVVFEQPLPVAWYA